MHMLYKVRMTQMTQKLAVKHKKIPDRKLQFLLLGQF